MTAALEGGEWSAARPGRTLHPGETRYPLYRKLGGPQGRSGRAENLVPTGIRSRTVQPVVSKESLNIYEFARGELVTVQRTEDARQRLFGCLLSAVKFKITNQFSD